MDLNTQHGKMKDDELKSDLNHRSCWGSDGRRQTPSWGRKKTQKTDWTSDDGDVITAGSVCLNQTVLFTGDVTQVWTKTTVLRKWSQSNKHLLKARYALHSGTVHRSVEVTSLHMLPRHVALLAPSTCCFWCSRLRHSWPIIRANALTGLSFYLG